jgi:hypothetical protein
VDQLIAAWPSAAAIPCPVLCIVVHKVRGVAVVWVGCLKQQAAKGLPVQAGLLLMLLLLELEPEVAAGPCGYLVVECQ